MVDNRPFVRYSHNPLNRREPSRHLIRMGMCTRQSDATEKGQQPAPRGPNNFPPVNETAESRPHNRPH
jgi:hypothetical protein